MPWLFQMCPEYLDFYHLYLEDTSHTLYNFVGEEGSHITQAALELLILLILPPK